MSTTQTEILQQIDHRDDDTIDSRELIDALQPNGILNKIDEKEKNLLVQELDTIGLKKLSDSFLREITIAYQWALHRHNNSCSSGLDETIINAYTTLRSHSSIQQKLETIIIDPFEKHKTILATIDSKKDTMISWEEMQQYLTPQNATETLKQFKDVFKDPYEFHGYRLDRLRQSYNNIRMNLETEKLSLPKDDILLFQFCSNLFQPLTDLNSNQQKLLTMDASLKTLSKEIANTNISAAAVVDNKPRQKKEKQELEETSLEELTFQDKVIHLGLDCLVSLYQCQLQVLAKSGIEKKNGKWEYPTGNIGLNIMPNECYVVDALAKQIHDLGGEMNRYTQQRTNTAQERLTKRRAGETLIAKIGNLQYAGAKNIFSNIPGYDQGAPLQKYSTRTGIDFFGISNHALAELGRLYRAEKDDRVFNDPTGKTNKTIIYGGDHHLAEIKGLFSGHLRSLMGNNTIVGQLWQTRSDEKDIAGSLGSFEDSEFFDAVQGIKESKLRKDTTRSTHSPDKDFYPYIHTLVFGKEGALAQAATEAESKVPHGKIDIKAISRALNVQIGMIQDHAMRKRLQEYFNNDGLRTKLNKEIETELQAQTKTLDTVAMNITLAEIAGSHPEQLLEIALKQGLQQSNALRSFLNDEHITIGAYNDQPGAFLKDPRGLAVQAGKIGEFVDFLCRYCQQFPTNALKNTVNQKSQSMQADYYNTAMVTKFGTEVINATLQANPSVTKSYAKKEAALRLYADISGAPGGGRSDKTVKRTESTSKLILQQVVIFAISGGIGSMASGILWGTRAAGGAINAARLVTNGSVFHISASVMQNMLVAKSLGEWGALNAQALTDVHGYIKSIAFIKVNSIFAGISGKIAGNMANNILKKGGLITGEIVSMMATERTLGVAFGEKLWDDAFTKDDLVNAVGITLGLKLAHIIMPNQQVIIDSVVRDGNGKVIDITASIMAGGKKVGKLINGKIKVVQEGINKTSRKEDGQKQTNDYKQETILSDAIQQSMQRIEALDPELHNSLQSLINNHPNQQKIIATTAERIANKLESLQGHPLQQDIAKRIIEVLGADHTIEYKIHQVDMILQKNHESAEKIEEKVNETEISPLIFQFNGTNIDASSLIPKSVLQRGPVEVRALGDTHDGSIRFIVIEKSQTPVSDPEAFKKLKNPPVSVPGKITISKKTIPAGVDRMHYALKSEIEKGNLGLYENVVFHIDIKTDPKNSQALYVGKYDGIKGKGIATDFYTNTLPSFAKQHGFRYIIGKNDANNIGFFTKRLGRYTIKEIKQEYQNQFGDNTHDFDTVQFLYAEDITTYVRQEKIKTQHQQPQNPSSKPEKTPRELIYRKQAIEKAAEDCGDPQRALDIYARLKDLIENKAKTETMEKIKQDFDTERARFEANPSNPEFAPIATRLKLARQALNENNLSNTLTPAQEKAIIWAHLRPYNKGTLKILLSELSKEQALALTDNNICGIFEKLKESLFKTETDKCFSLMKLDSLEINQNITISTQHNDSLILKYLGNGKFKVIYYINNNRSKNPIPHRNTQIGKEGTIKLSNNGDRVFLDIDGQDVSIMIFNQSLTVNRTQDKFENNSYFETQKIAPNALSNNFKLYQQSGTSCTFCSYLNACNFLNLNPKYLNQNAAYNGLRIKDKRSLDNKVLHNGDPIPTIHMDERFKESGFTTDYHTNIDQLQQTFLDRMFRVTETGTTIHHQVSYVPYEHQGQKGYLKLDSLNDPNRAFEFVSPAELYNRLQNQNLVVCYHLFSYKKPGKQQPGEQQPGIKIIKPPQQPGEQQPGIIIKKPPQQPGEQQPGIIIKKPQQLGEKKPAGEKKQEIIIKKITNPDGTVTTKHPDGRTTTQYPDGRTTTQYPDGRTTTQYTNGIIISKN